MAHYASIAHVARVYDYLLGGKDNFTADREAADVGRGWWCSSQPSSHSDPGQAPAETLAFLR